MKNTIPVRLDPDRVKQLDKKVLSAKDDQSRPTRPLVWRGKTEERKVVRVETKWLRLNMNNGRTHAAQASKGNPRLFEDPTTAKAQKAQEELIRNIDDGKPHKILMKELERGQDEPGICTADGYLINGNRRCVALRDMGQEYMDVLVLARDAQPGELYELELNLQLRQDTKLKYGEIDRILHIVRIGLQQHGKTREHMAELLGGNSTKDDVAEMESILALVDDYLAALGKPGRYDFAQEHYTGFLELNSRLKQLKESSVSLAERDLIKYSAFCAMRSNVAFIKVRKQLVQVRDGKGDTKSSSKPFVDTVVTKLPSKTTAEKKTLDGPAIDAALLEFDAVVNSPGTSSSAIEAVTSQIKNVLTLEPEKPAFVSVREAIVSGLETAGETERDHKHADAPQNLAQQALDKLNNINISQALATGLNNAKSFNQFVDILKDLQARIKELETEVQKSKKRSK